MKNKKRTLYFAIIGIVLVVFALLSFLCGAARISLSDMVAALSGDVGHESDRVILLRLRVPRLLAAFLAGIGLSTGGLLLQTITGNALASPNIIGVNAGAGLGVILTLCLFPGNYALPPFLAFAGALITTAVILTLSARNRSKSTLILSGVAVSAILNAVISFLCLLFPDILQSYAAFSAGSLNGVFLNDLPIPAMIILIAFAAAQAVAPKLNLLCLGDGIASSLGVRVRALRTGSVILACASCAAVVSFAGLLGFVGLIVPHAARALFGNDLRVILPASALIGATLVTVSDLAGRMIFAPTEIPVGIIMAFLGAPFFLILIIRRRSAYDRL